MKKFLIWICMITCIFGLTACGSEDGLTDYEQEKVNLAQSLAAYAVVPVLSYYYMDEDAVNALNEYTMDEIAYFAQLRQAELYGQVFFEADGYGFYTAAQSFQSAADSVGEVKDIGETSAKINGNQIIVEVEVICEKKNATAEVIFSNDRFLDLESASLNPESTVGELMTGAALNTLIGMGTVFAVLILISGIISCFKVVPALQKRAAEKKTAKSGDDQSLGVDNAVTQIEAQETISGDDLELAAVIAAAIAAYEGSASADGFVVRSIRRLR